MIQREKSRYSDIEQQANFIMLCEPLGHQGPFLNRAFYATYPGWEAMGECACCGSTVDVARILAERGQEDAHGAPAFSL